MDFNSVLFAIGDKLPKDGLAVSVLKEKFDCLSENSQQEVVKQLPMLKLKSPALVFWVGTFLFGGLGVGRFMIGDMVLGFVRLGLTILGVICAVFAISTSNDAISFLSNTIKIINWIWWIVDMFLVGKKLRKQNYEKIENLMK